MEDTPFILTVEPATNGFVISQRFDEDNYVMHIAKSEQELTKIIGTLYGTPVETFSKPAAALN